MAGGEEHTLHVGEALLCGAVEFEDAHEGGGDIRRGRRLAAGGDQRDAAGEFGAVGRETAHDAVAVCVADEVGRRAAHVLDGSRHVVCEVVQRQAVDGGRAAIDTAVADPYGPVSGGFEVVHERVEIADAASQGGNADHQVSIAPLGHFNFAVFHFGTSNVFSLALA